MASERKMMSEPAPLVIGASNNAYLFYGPPGSGKTTMAARMAGALPDGEKALFLDMDRKLASLTNLDPKWAKKIDVWTPTATLSGDEIGVARVERYDSKKNVIPGTQGSIPKNPQGYYELVKQSNKLLVSCPYSLVVLDTLSTTVEHLQRLICYHHQVSTFTLPLWGVFATNIEELRAGLLSLPCRKVFIAHTRTSENEDTNEVRVLPSVPGQTGEKLVKDFNEAYFFLGRSGPSSPYKALTTASRKYTCRTTLPIPAEVPLDDLLKAIMK
jgi:energy-coupling factor transporter ATP-binding protein EcfA2